MFLGFYSFYVFVVFILVLRKHVTYYFNFKLILNIFPVGYQTRSFNSEESDGREYRARNQIL